MNYIDFNYANQLSSRLSNYKVKSNNPFKANFRCPYCGDSKVSKYKTRGWIIQAPTFFYYYCHNCYKKTNLHKFIKDIAPDLYEQYIQDLLFDDLQTKTENEIAEPDRKVVKLTKNPLNDIKTISKLSHDHPAKKYVISRKIPFDRHYMLYYTPKFNKWINKYIANKLRSDKDEPRLVIPMFDSDGKIIGVCGRAFKKDSIRYITIMFDQTKPKIFGLDRVNTKKKFFILEGAIDSLFIDNSVAMLGADVSVNSIENNKNAVFVFDNEPRNIQIVKRMEKVVSEGYSIVIWPSIVDTGLDINDMAKLGFDVQKLVNENIYSGLTAELELGNWKKT